MFTKILNLLLMYLGEKLSLQSQAQKSLAAFGIEKIRKMIGATTALVFAMIFFSHSVAFLMDDLKTVYQATGVWGFSEIAIVPLAVLIGVAITLYFSFRDKTWSIQAEPPKLEHQPKTDFQPLVETVNVLLTDIIDERRKARETVGASHDF